MSTENEHIRMFGGQRPGHQSTRLWAIIAIDGEGNEGIAGILVPEEVGEEVYGVGYKRQTLAMTDERNVDFYRQIRDQLNIEGGGIGQRFELREYSLAGVVE